VVGATLLPRAGGTTPPSAPAAAPPTSRTPCPGCPFRRGARRRPSSSRSGPAVHGRSVPQQTSRRATRHVVQGAVGQSSRLVIGDRVVTERGRSRGCCATRRWASRKAAPTSAHTRASCPQPGDRPVGGSPWHSSCQPTTSSQRDAEISGRRVSSTARAQRLPWSEQLSRLPPRPVPRSHPCPAQVHRVSPTDTRQLSTGAVDETLPRPGPGTYGDARSRPVAGLARNVRRGT